MATTTQQTTSPWPLQRNTQRYSGKSPSATTDESQQYKDMLGSQAASEDVGLFYQLNQTAGEANVEVGNYQKGESRLFKNIANYGNYADPIEAGGEYA